MIAFYAKTSGHTSIAFRLLEKTLISLNAGVQWLFVVTSFIILSLVFIAIYRISEHRAFAVLMFVLTSNFFLTMNIVSQFIAISICLISCEFAEKRKPLPFFLLVGLAITFHSSAIVFLPVYFLPRLKIPAKWSIVSVGACACVAPLLTLLIKWVVTVLVPKYPRYFSHSTEFEWMFFAIGAAVLLVSLILLQVAE